MAKAIVGTKPEKEPKVEVGREADPLDLLAVQHKDPGYAYRWINKRALESKRVQGWEPVRKTKEEIDELAEYGVRSGTTIERQDLILCRMPRAMNDRLKARKQAKADRQMNSVKRQGLKKFSSERERITGAGSLETLSELEGSHQDDAIEETTERVPRS